jgi:uncharacterized protein (TIGR00255 family)
MHPRLLNFCSRLPLPQKESPMILSMTGYARHEDVLDDSVLTWEARSVNHRFLEVSFRLPEELRAHEPALKARVQARLGRGKVDLNLRLAEAPDAATSLVVNEAMVARLTQAAARIGAILGDDRGLRTVDLLRWPGVIEDTRPSREGLVEAALAGLERALSALIEARGNEGRRLAEMLESRCAQILVLVGTIADRLPEVREQQLVKMRERVARLGVEADEGRLEQEVAIIAGRMDVAEELDRLVAHVAELRDNLVREEPVGRRLDFLIQELNREANTLASKTVDTEVTRAAVELKVLIEQMREQVQNVE